MLLHTPAMIKVFVPVSRTALVTSQSRVASPASRNEMCPSTGGFSPTYALRDLSAVSASNRFYSGDEHLRMLERITLSFNGVKEKLGKQPSGAVLDRVLAQHFPGFRLDPDLRELILGGKTDERNFSYSPQSALGRMVARQTGYYWGTSGHTPQPVLVGAIGPGAALFHGYQDNTDFAKHLHQLIRGK
jgi:alkaline phosphatase